MAIHRTSIPSTEGDPLIPILNLVCMLIPLLLYGAVFVRFVTLDVGAPKHITDQNPPSAEALQLTVTVTHQGFHFKVNPQFRLPWMTATSEGVGGPDIPKKDDDWDYRELQRRLQEIKDLHRQTRSFMLNAEDSIALEVLIKTMDYARGSQQAPLFPDVTLASRGVV